MYSRWRKPGTCPLLIGQGHPQRIAGSLESKSFVYGTLPFSVEGRPSWSQATDDRIRRGLASGDLGRVRSGQATYISNNPPLYYLLQAVPYRAFHGASFLDRLFAMRLFSSLFAGLHGLFHIPVPAGTAAADRVGGYGGRARGRLPACPGLHRGRCQQRLPCVRGVCRGLLRHRARLPTRAHPTHGGLHRPPARRRVPHQAHDRRAASGHGGRTRRPPLACVAAGSPQRRPRSRRRARNRSLAIGRMGDWAPNWGSSARPTPRRLWPRGPRETPARPCRPGPATSGRRSSHGSRS